MEGSSALAYASQHRAIRRMAKEYRISDHELDAYFERKMLEISHKYPTEARDWQIHRAEKLTWERFCKFTIPFPIWCYCSKRFGVIV
jgi:hypothetical protein